jgi:hypothetical protein
LFYDPCFQRSLLDAPKFIGRVENGVNEIQDFILGQYIFIMQIFDDEAQFIMSMVLQKNALFSSFAYLLAEINIVEPQLIVSNEGY